MRMDTTNKKAWQREVRERKERQYKGEVPVKCDISKAECRRITRQEAESIILEYEWLGTMGKCEHAYGIFFDGVLAGAVTFGHVATPSAGDMFGKQYRDIAICLERGACTYWAHPHSASKLISYAVNDMAKTTKYRIFFAYSDDSAGEIGTVYQACNWLYLGRSAGGGSQNKLITPEGELRDSRGIMSMAQKYVDYPIQNRTEARKILHANGWQTRKTKPKCKYVIVKGNKREVREIMKNLQKPVLPYPKRTEESLTVYPLVCKGDVSKVDAIRLVSELNNKVSFDSLYCEPNSIWENCRESLIGIYCYELDDKVMSQKHYLITNNADDINNFTLESVVY